MKRFIFTLVFFVVLSTIAFAHSGKTDANGGHYDHSTGEYHYHHGYPAHQHPNGICPYAYDDQTNHSSGTTSDTSSDPFENESTDGSYEDAYNAGLEYYFAELRRNEDWAADIENILDDLYSEYYIDDYTSLSSIGYVYCEAFNEGYDTGAYALDTWIEENSVGLSEIDPADYPKAYQDMIGFDEAEESDAETSSSLEYSYRTDYYNARAQLQEAKEQIEQLKATEAVPHYAFYAVCTVAAFLLYLLFCSNNLRRKAESQLAALMHSSAEADKKLMDTEARLKDMEQQSLGLKRQCESLRRSLNASAAKPHQAIQIDEGAHPIRPENPAAPHSFSTWNPSVHRQPGQRERFQRALHEQYEIKGMVQQYTLIRTLTGNTYHTTLSTCDCYDFQCNLKRARPCKHIYFLAIHSGISFENIFPE